MSIFPPVTANIRYLLDYTVNAIGVTVLLLLMLNTLLLCILQCRLRPNKEEPPQLSLSRRASRTLKETFDRSKSMPARYSLIEKSVEEEMEENEDEAFRAEGTEETPSPQ